MTTFISLLYLKLFFLPFFSICSQKYFSIPCFGRFLIFLFYLSHLLLYTTNIRATNASIQYSIFYQPTPSLGATARCKDGGWNSLANGKNNVANNPLKIGKEAKSMSCGHYWHSSFQHRDWMLSLARPPLRPPVFPLIRRFLLAKFISIFFGSPQNTNTSLSLICLLGGWLN